VEKRFPAHHCERSAAIQTTFPPKGTPFTHAEAWVVVSFVALRLAMTVSSAFFNTLLNLSSCQ
jgi:hypothetical protein